MDENDKYKTKIGNNPRLRGTQFTTAGEFKDSYACDVYISNYLIDCRLCLNKSSDTPELVTKLITLLTTARGRGNVTFVEVRVRQSRNHCELLRQVLDCLAPSPNRYHLMGAK